MIKASTKCSLIISALLFIGLSSALAEDFQCEVMSLEGTAFVTNSQASRQPLKEGDILKADDLIEVNAGSSVDLAYDKDWQNVTRLEENSKVEIKSIFPTTLKMTHGGVYAKLKSLPTESTFEVQTPTAIATVRGTEYRAVYTGEGTQVFNYSDSKVYVFGRDESGTIGETPMIVENAQTTEIAAPGSQPTPPHPMSPDQVEKGGRSREGIDRKIRENVDHGRVSKMPDMRAIEKMHHERMESVRSGRAGLVSAEPGQNKGGNFKENMAREDKMLKVMQGTENGLRQKMERPENMKPDSGMPGKIEEGQANPIKRERNHVDNSQNFEKHGQGQAQDPNSNNNHPNNKPRGSKQARPQPPRPRQ